MLINITTLFHKKIKAIKDELNSKNKINESLSKFLKEEILKNTDIDCQLSCTFNKGIVKIETDNKLIAQEIALRIRYLEEKLKKEGIVFRKLLI